MSSFTTPVILKLLEKRKFEVYEKFEYHVNQKGSAEVIKIPKGFITDLASTPRILWSFLPPHDTYAKAAIVHDFMYMNNFKKEYSDNVFKEMLKVLNISKFVIWILYHGVKWFGKV